MSVAVNWNDEAAKLPEKVMMEALWLLGQDTVREAMNNIPLDTGTLRRSGTVTVGGLPDPNKVYSEAQKKSMAKAYEGDSMGLHKVVFVSYNTPYARKLHESLNWKPRNWKYGRRRGKTVRRPKPAVGGPKWIERAIPKSWGRLQIMVNRAKKKMGVTL